METVPSAMLRALVYPRGARLYRKPKKPPVETYWGRGYVHYGPGHSPPRGHWDEQAQRFIWESEYGENSRINIVSTTERHYSVTDISYRQQNALQDWEFIAWFGPLTKLSSWARCRVCGLIRWGSDERALHVKGDCRRTLFATLALLRRDNKCTICNQAGGLFKSLGVFFCSQKCLEKYKHDDTDKEAQANFKAALAITGYKG